MALIKCPDCGHSVSDAAPACPSCGRPIAPIKPQAPVFGAHQKAAKKSNQVSGFFTVIVLVVLGFWIYNKANEGSPSSPATTATEDPPKPVFHTSAQLLASRYEQNEVAADNDMRGQLIAVTGTVQSIDKDFTDSVVVDLATSNEYMPARMGLKDTEKTAAASLHRGQSLTVVCEQMSRVVGSPSGRNCVIDK